MKRFVAPALLLVTAVLLAVVPTSPASAQPDPVSRKSLLVEPLGGQDIFTSGYGWDYRVGPALVASGGTTHQLNCGPVSFLDPRRVIRYTSSTDGKTWAPERVVVQPSVGGSDAAGTCDPAVAQIGDYYYLAYTGISATGRRQVFAARALSLAGPYSKWNGATWTGGTPAAIAPLPPGDDASGPSLILRGGRIYLYFNVRLDGTTYQTQVAIAVRGRTGDETWPQRLVARDEGALEHPASYTGVDCVGGGWFADTDVKYDDASGRFLALTTNQSYPKTVLQAYESVDGGFSFTKAVITRGDYHQGARTPGILADDRGHVPTSGPTAIGYAHSTTCGRADLHWSDTSQRLLITGAVDEPLDRGGAANWRAVSGRWGYSPGLGLLQQDTSPGMVAETSLQGRVASAASTISVRLAGNESSRGWAGIHFGKAHPDDTIDESGYTAYVETTWRDPRVCLVKAGFGELGCTTARGVSGIGGVTLTAVQADGNLKVYLNGRTALGVASTDADDPFLGGYVGLVTYQAYAWFNHFSAGDNVPADSTSADWSPRGGTWTFPDDRTLANASSSGQLNLQTSLDLPASELSQLGVGTYRARVSIGDDAMPKAWAGLALGDNSGSGWWGSDGYLVFVRANGNVGVYKAGAGQVVADIATGLDPTQRPVRLRVLKTGGNLQVYVSNLPDPLVNWTDPGPSVWPIGSFGVANYLAPATFADVTYSGNAAQ